MQNTHVYSFPFDFAKSRKMLFKPKLKHLNAYPVIPIDAKTQKLKLKLILTSLVVDIDILAT